MTVVKIIILGGFLGSGKTTVLLQLSSYLLSVSELSYPYKVFVLENEVGAEGIDQEFLNSYGLQVKALENGCICCNLSGELVPAVAKIEKQYHPEWLIIETTGLADPGLVRENLKQGLGRDTFICILVDASRWKRFLIPMKSLLQAQVEGADLVLLNKIDLVSEEIRKKVAFDIDQFQPNVCCIPISASNQVELNVWKHLREAIK